MILTETETNLDDIETKNKILQNMASIYIVPDHASEGGFALI